MYCGIAESEKTYSESSVYSFYTESWCVGVSKTKVCCFLFFLSTQFSNVILRKETQISVLISGWLHLFRTIIHMTEEPKPLHNPEAGVHTVFVPPAV